MTSIIALIVANIIWGAGAPIFKYSLTDIPTFMLAFIRFFFAGLLFLPFILKRFPKKINASTIWHIVIGAFWGITINIACFFLGLTLAPSINSTVIASLGPVLLYFLSVKMLKEKPKKALLNGIGIAFLGVLIITVAPTLFSSYAAEKSNSSTITNVMIGNLFFILATVGAVLMSIENKKIIKKIDCFALTGIQFIVGSLFFIPFVFMELESFSISALTYKSWIGIIYGIFFSSAIAYFAHNFALKKLSAASTGVFAYLTPIASLAVAMPLLGEMPDIFFIVGAILIVIGVKTGSDPV